METQNSSKNGSVVGAVLLIAGCCIGAGMLGLPVISRAAGFQPSMLMFFISWIFMTTTALLLLEVNLWFSKEVSIISMANRTLGIFGKAVAWLCFVFLFYALGVAYISGSGELIANFIHGSLGFQFPFWIGNLLVSAIFGIFVFLGTRSVDIFNRFLMAGMIATYITLIVLGAPHVNEEYLKQKDWSLATIVLPVLIISFGFHNLIPSLTSYLNSDVKRLRLSIILGSAIALIIYIIWEWLILGLVPFQMNENLQEILQDGDMATEILKLAIGASWVVDIAQYFALFAILTSFLGNSLSFVDFLADGFQIKKTPIGKLFLCILVIVPPFILSLIYPRIFLVALNYAGAFGAMTLFGILPALMVWSGRYYKNMGMKPLVPGGKVTLSIVILFALFVMGLQFKGA